MDDPDLAGPDGAAEAPGGPAVHGEGPGGGHGPDHGARPAGPQVGDLTIEGVADLREQLHAADIDATVAALDDLLDRLRPAAQVRRTLTLVPAQKLRAAALVFAARRAGPAHAGS